VLVLDWLCLYYVVIVMWKETRDSAPVPRHQRTAAYLLIKGLVSQGDTACNKRVRPKAESDLPISISRLMVGTQSTRRPAC
jgi:hypothetical protein